MKKYILLLFLIILSSCVSNYCSSFESDKVYYEKLISYIKRNPNEFFNSSAEPRIYYTYNYQKSYEEFKKTKSGEHINQDEFESLKKIFKNLSIETFYIYDNDDLLFKVGSKDFFVNEFEFYIAYLEDYTYEDLKIDFDIKDYSLCEGNWFYLLSRNSIAN